MYNLANSKEQIANSKKMEALCAFIFNPKRIVFFMFAIIVFVGFAFMKIDKNVFAAQGINKQINFQGKLVNSNGTNVADGLYDIVFKIYTVSSGGAAVWTESRTGGNQVQVTAGLFQVSLGSVTSLPGSVNFNTDNIYLGITVGADSEMSPRVRFASVPQAFNAEMVNGLTVTNASDLPFSSTTTLKIADGKTVVINNGLTFSGTDNRTFTFPSSNGNVVTEDFTQILTNKTIGSTGLTFSGATTDIVTVTNEDFVIIPNGLGKIGFNTTSPLATFDVRANGAGGGTVAVASLSGNTSFVTLLADNGGAGDIIAASTGGVTKFVVKNSGELYTSNYQNDGGILYTATSGLIKQTAGGSEGTCLTFTGGLPAWGTCVSSNDASKWVLSTANGTLSPINNTLDFLWGGTTTTSANFKITGNTALAGTKSAASVSANTSFAGFVVDNAGVGDLFTASKSGATKFVITNGGNLQFAGETNFLTTLASAATGARTLTIPTSGASDTFCLLTAANCGGSSNWDVINGAITPKLTSTLDFLLGGTSTTSAKFAVIGINDARGTQTASVSGNIVLDSAGSLQTTKNQTLTLGGSSTGLIKVANNNGTPFVTFDTVNSFVGIGTAAPSSNLHIAQNSSSNNAFGITNNSSSPLLSGHLVSINASANTNLGNASGDIFNIGSDLIHNDTSTSNITSNFIDVIRKYELGSSGPLNLLGDLAKLSSNCVELSTGPCVDTSNVLRLIQNYGKASGAVLNIENFGIGSAAAILSNSGGQSALIINKTGNAGDIFTASASGTPIFSITNAGGIKLGASVGDGSQCLLGGASASWGACSTGIDQSKWVLSTTNGTLSPINNTLDFLWGGTTTTSANFKITGNSAQAGTISAASVSANTSFAGLVIDQRGVGDLFTASSSGMPRFIIRNDGSFVTLPTIGSTSTQEGTIYYDSDDDQLKVYANGKWQSDRATATVIVGTSNTTGGTPRNYEKADFVCGTSDCDTTIESAIAALPAGGGVVQLLEGTYIIDSDGIDITKSNTSIIGAGKSTILQRGWDAASDDGVMSAESVSNITIADLTIDGCKAVAGTCSTAYTGFENIGILFNAAVTYSTIRNIYVHDNDAFGISLSSSSNNNTIIGNNAQSNGGAGIRIFSSSSYNIIKGNNTQSNFSGIFLGASTTNNTVVGNNVQSSISNGIGLSSSNYNTITGNNISDVGVNVDGINMDDADYNIVSSNQILDTSGSRYGINITISISESNYIIGNEISGAGFIQEINDLGTGTTIQHREKFEVDGGPSTSSVASVSGQTSFAALVIDNTTGDLITASSSGNTQFVIKNNGAVGIGVNLPTAKLDVAGTASISGALNFRSGNGSIQTTGKNTLTIGGSTTGMIDVANGSGNIFATFDTINSRLSLGLAGSINGYLAFFSSGVGETAPTISANSTGDLTLTAPTGTLIMGSGIGNINLNPGTSDIIANLTSGNFLGQKNGVNYVKLSTLGTLPTASISAISSFAALMLDNSGIGDIFTASKSGATKFAILNNGNLQFAGQTNFLTTLRSGATLARTLTMPTTAGDDTFCLLTAANCASGASSNWTLTGGIGILRPNNGTLDVLFGLNATNASTSAKFAILGMADDTATNNPSASVSAITGNNAGKGVALFGDGSIQSFRNNNLTIGGNTTGNIILNGDGINSVGIGTDSPGSTTKLHLNGDDFSLAFLSGANPRIELFDNTGGAGNNLELLIGTIVGDGAGDFHAYDLTNFRTVYSYFKDNNYFNILQEGSARVGIGITAPLGTLHVNGGNTGGNSSLIIDQIGATTNDIFTASASGTPKFTITNAGGIKLGTDVGDGTQCLLGGTTASWGSCGGAPAGGGSNWTLSTTNGTLSPNNNTLDFLWGGTSSSSANFRITGKTANAGTKSAASVSASTSFAGLVIDQVGVGDIFTASSSGLARFTVKQGGDIAGGLSSSPWTITATGAAIMNSWEGGGLSSDCSGASSKLLWDASTKKFSCGSIGSGIGTDSQLQVTSIGDVTIANTATALGTVSITPSTATGDVIVRLTFSTRSLNNADQTITAQIRSGSNCTGSILASNTSSLTSSNAQNGPSINVLYLSVDPGVSSQSYTACATSTTNNGAGSTGGTISAEVIDTGADLAEFYTTNDSTIVPGDIVSLDSSLSTGVKKSNTPYDSQVMGIISTRPAIAIGSVDKEGIGAVPVALTGRVPVKVTTINGPVKAGDYLTSSSVPGVAMKATKAGRVVAMAMSDFDGEGEGVVLSFVKSTFFEGESILKLLPGLVEIKTKNDKAYSLEIIDGLLGYNSKNNENTNSQILTDKIFAGISIVSPEIFTRSLATDNISPISGENLNIDLQNNGALVIKDSYGNSVITFDASGSAVFKGTINADQIIANKIVGLELAQHDKEDVSALIATNSAVLNFDTKLNNLSDNQKILEESMASISAQISKLPSVNLLAMPDTEGKSFVSVENFSAFGTTVLSEASIMSTLSIGNNMTFTGSSINTVGQDLEIQPLKQGAVTFLGGLIKFDTDGKVKFEEDVEFAKNVDVKGAVTANSVTANNLLLGQGTTKVISETEVEATAAAGLVTLKKSTDHIKVNNPLVRENSFIFITPKTKSSHSLFLLEQVEGKDSEMGSFTVGIDGLTEKDIKFNYLIVN